MRRSPWPLLVVCALVGTGCASPVDSTPVRVPDPSRAGTVATTASSAPASGTASPDEPIGGASVDFRTVEIVSATGGGVPANGGLHRAVRVDSPDAVDRFTDGLSDELAADVRSAARRAVVAPTDALIAQQIGYQCQPVASVIGVHRVADGLVITGSGSGDGSQECMAPVTSIAIVTVDADAV